MTTPIPDKRKRLTTNQRTALFDAHNGICVICGGKIHGKKWTDEHIRPLGMLGSNDADNRGPAHDECARDKTRADLSMIAKAKRVRAKHIGAWPKSRTPIKSRGFPKARTMEDADT